MALQTRTFAVLLDEIKRESRVKGSDNLDFFIKSVINELLLDYADKIRYFELLLREQPLTLVEAQADYALPSDFHKMRAVRYTIGAGLPYSIYPKGQYVPQTAGGNPRFYEIAGATITIMPATNIKDADTLVLDYYKYPTELVDDGDIFPIPRLIAPLKLKAIHRVLIYNRELNVASAIRGESMEQEYRSATALPNE
jgi:hypothetical protein